MAAKKKSERRVFKTRTGEMQQHDENRCQGIVKSTGKLCRASAQAGSGFCPMHDENPVAKLKAQLARSRGGQTIARRARGIPTGLKDIKLDSADSIRAVLESLLALSAENRIAPSQVNAIRGLCDSAARLTQLRVELEIAELVSAREKARELREHQGGGR